MTYLFSNTSSIFQSNGTSITTNNPLPVTAVAGNVSITTGNINLSNLPDTAVTAFEEPLAVGITPVLQADAVYGLDPEVWSQSTLRGGNITVSNSAWSVSSGTSPGGYARLASSNYVTYPPGQGLMFRWTAAFTANANNKDAVGIDNIVQTTGPIDREDGYAIGYSGSTANVASGKIGILHRRGGKVELRELLITTAPTGSQTANVTLDGTSYLISLTSSSSTAYTATEIATKLRANVIASNTWDIEACDSLVTFSYYAPGPRSGSYSFSSSGTGTLAAGSFVQLQAGVSPTDTWTYVDNWNGTVPNFDPTKLNVFGMDMRWLGAGRVRFFMEDPTTGKMVIIHTKLYSSTALVPHIYTPSLRVVYRSGTTNPAITPSTNVVVTGASIFGGIQGQITQTALSQGYYSTVSGNRNQDLVHHLLSIQNPYVRSGTINKSSLVLQNLTVSAQGNDPSVIFVIKNAVGTSDYLVFNPLPIANKFYFAQYSTSSVTANLSLNTINNIQTLAINSSSTFDLLPYNLTLSPGDYVSVFFISTSIISRTAIGMTWRVD